MAKTEKVECSYCGTLFEKNSAEIKRQRKKKGDKVRFFCSKRCIADYRDSLIDNPEKECVVCGEKFTPPKDNRGKKTCSKKCASDLSRSFYTEESKQKAREKVIKAWGEGIYDTEVFRKSCNRDGKRKPLIVKKCPQCNLNFETKRTEQKFCNVKCARASRKTKGLRSYRTACKFEFSLKDYPDEFDFDLIRKYGWYSPTNKKNNLTGISRDHMVSVRYGFDNNVDPEILKHPANCRLMRHGDNVSKGINNHITLEELKARIKIWDEKYK